MTDIKPNNNAICDLKCKYTFNYKDMDATVFNTKSYLYIKLNNNNQLTEPVTYNSHKYTPEIIFLFYPSANKYNGKNADAEIFIHHKSLTGGYLLLCIPIMISNDTSKSSNLLGHIIDKAYINSLTKEKIDYKLSNKINLNDLIPMKKYYANTSSIYRSVETNVLIFSIDDNAYLTIKEKHYEKLKNTILKISNTTFNLKLTNNTYSNINGPTISSNVVEDDIYIDCKPYIEDDEIIGGEKNINKKTNVKETSISKSNTNSKSFMEKSFHENMKTPAFLIIFIIILVLLLIIPLWFIIKIYKSYKIKVVPLPTVPLIPTIPTIPNV